MRNGKDIRQINSNFPQSLNEVKACMVNYLQGIIKGNHRLKETNCHYALTNNSYKLAIKLKLFSSLLV